MSSRLKWIISICHAFLLIGITAFWMNTAYTYGDESFVIRWASIVKRIVLQIDQDPPGKDYLFINLAYDKAIIPREEGPGNEVITDRKQLAAFFNIIKRNQDSIRFTVCDVFLKGSSDYDSVLQSSLNGIRNIVFPAHANEDGGLEELAVKVPAALADYQMASGGFLKFKLFQHEQLKTLPVYLYEQTTGKELLKKNGFYFDGEYLSMNSQIIDYQIRAHELLEEAEYPVVSLSELMLLPEDIMVSEFLRGRMIFMGDFDSDRHDTIFGSTPGTLILANVYLTLKDGQHLIGIWWLLFLLISYTLFTNLMLFPPKVMDSENMHWAGTLLGSAAFLVMVSVISYLLFNKHIQVLILTLYINLLRFIIKVDRSQLTGTNAKKWIRALPGTYYKFK